MIPDDAPFSGSSTPGDRLDRIIANLGEIVREETAALQSGRVVDLADFNARKSHGLLELTRAARASDERALTGQRAEDLKHLRQGLAENEALLKVHLEAVQEVADLMTNAISESESDGTYSANLKGVMSHYV